MFGKPKLKTLFKKTLKDKIRELAQQINHQLGHKRLIPVTVSTGPRMKKR